MSSIVLASNCIISRNFIAKTWVLNTHNCCCTQKCILNRLLELRSEVHTFLIEHRSPHASLFQDTDWLAKMCYLADLFSKLNKLNMSLQGKGTSILNLYDKVGGFLKKAELWRRASAQGDFTCFPQVDDFLSSEDVNRAPVKLVIVAWDI